MSDRFTIFQGETRPSLVDQILIDGEAVVFGVGDTAKLQGRLSGADPDVLLIDSPAVIETPPPDGQVRYDWQAGDTDLAGDLIAWWHLDIGGNQQSTPAFVIPIVDQAAVDPGVGLYASVLDVKSLAGFLSSAWTPTSDTDEADLATFLAMTSGEIDAVLLSRAAVLPLDKVGTVALALRSHTADGALVRALGATWPNDAPEGVAELRRDARARYAAGIAALAAGTHPAALALGTTTVASAAGSLETDEPSYGCWGNWEPADWNPSLAPSLHRGQRF